MNVGELLEGRFELCEVLGEGGMGQVFRARDRELDRFVAVKTLLPQFLADPAAMDDMKREVRLAQRLHHPNIVAVYDYRVHQRTPYIVMEHVDGRSLVHHIYAHPDHVLPEGDFRALAEPIMTGVEYAHRMGVIHRDLKPENIMVAPANQVKLMDFGIAAAVQANYTRMTGRSSSMSVAYASPEQINGADPAPSMDIYSLGCVFYTMLCGHPPFYQGEIVHQQLTRQAPPLPGVSSELNNVVLACLAKDAAARPQSVTEIRTLLQGNRTIRVRRLALRASSAPPAVAQGPLARSGSLTRRRAKGAAWLVVGGVAALALGLAWSLQPGADPAPPQRALAAAPGSLALPPEIQRALQGASTDSRWAGTESLEPPLANHGPPASPPPGTPLRVMSGASGDMASRDSTAVTGLGGKREAPGGVAKGTTGSEGAREQPAARGERPAVAAGAPPPTSQSFRSESPTPTLPAVTPATLTTSPRPAAPEPSPRPLGSDSIGRSMPAPLPPTPHPRQPDPDPATAGGLRVPAPASSRPQAPARLELRTRPSAEVTVDGMPRGRTPLEIDVTPGRHTIVLDHPDYQPLKRVLTLIPGESRAVTVNLKDEAVRRK